MPLRQPLDNPVENRLQALTAQRRDREDLPPGKGSPIVLNHGGPLNFGHAVHFVEHHEHRSLHLAQCLPNVPVSLPNPLFGFHHEQDEVHLPEG